MAKSKVVKAERTKRAASEKKTPKVNKKAKKPSTAEAVEKLHKRMLALEKAITPSPLHEDLHAKLLALEKSTDVRSLRFTLDKNTAELVRVTLLDKVELGGKAEVVMVKDVSVDSAPRPKGRWIKVQVEIAGNAGSTATIKVKNAEPDTLEVAVPDGQSSGLSFPYVHASW